MNPVSTLAHLEKAAMCDKGTRLYRLPGKLFNLFLGTVFQIIKRGNKCPQKSEPRNSYQITNANTIWQGNSTSRKLFYRHTQHAYKVIHYSIICCSKRLDTIHMPIKWRLLNMNYGSFIQWIITQSWERMRKLSLCGQGKIYSLHCSLKNAGRRTICLICHTLCKNGRSGCSLWHVHKEYGKERKGSQHNGGEWGRGKTRRWGMKVERLFRV